MHKERRHAKERPHHKWGKANTGYHRACEKDKRTLSDYVSEGLIDVSGLEKREKKRGKHGAVRDSEPESGGADLLIAPGEYIY